MIDTKELRRLTQAATPGPWTNHGRQPNVAGLPHSAVAAKTLLARVYSEAYGDVEQETANAAFIAAANPAAVSELLDRLEAAEAEALEEARLNGMGSEREAKHLAQIAALEKERDALRTALDALRGKAIDRSVDNAFARFAGVFGKGPDAPYPGMSEAFEKHFSQSFTDREWRAESGVWAAAWKAAKNHGAQPAPSVPEGWLRAVDEALVTAYVGVANADDTYELAKAKLNNLIGFHVDVATDPAVNGGWKLMPIEPTKEIYACFAAYDGTSYSNPFDFDNFKADYASALAAAPEAKP